MAEENSWTGGSFVVPPVTEKATSFVSQDQQKVDRFHLKWCLRFTPYWEKINGKKLTQCFLFKLKEKI